jgi:ammonia channel protein AmtB
MSLTMSLLYSLELLFWYTLSLPASISLLANVFLQWFGWFGFNGGSALGANGLASLAFANTQIATGTAFVTWVILDVFVKVNPPILFPPLSP